jgi:Eukaryotic aspartyl protease
MTGVGQTLPGQQPTIYSSNTFNPLGNPYGLAVSLDSGTTLSLLPFSLFTKIGSDYPGAALDYDGTAYIVPCKAPPGSVDFIFGNETIHIPYSDFIWQARPTRCQLGIAPVPDTDPKQSILGDSFLRAAYVVHDLENQEIWLGQADECGSNVVPLGTGVDLVPQISGCRC